MMNYVFFTGSCLLSFVLGMVIIPKILLISYKKRLFDMPDDRKVHQTPIPRLGGISFFPVILIVSCFVLGVRLFMGYPIDNIPVNEFLFFMVGGMMLFLIGVADDLIGVSYRYKFLVQVIAALMIVWPGEWLNSLGGLFGVWELPKSLGVLLSLFVVVYITNAINLIDGIDGLASGLSCIALFVLGVVCVVRGDGVYALLAFSTFGVIVPFWFYNVFGNARRGHKLFMGDTGSLILGYIISFLVIHLSRVETIDETVTHSNMVLAFSTLIVPLFDVVRVVLHRLREKKNPFLPDKNHFHHKLLRTGMCPRMVLVTILLVALFFIVLDYLLLDEVGVTWLFVMDIVCWTMLQLGINKAIQRHRLKVAQKTL